MSFESLERLIRRTANRIGLDVTRHRPEISEAGRLARMLAEHEVNLVFDVGANTGQFARSLRDVGYRHRLVSFEPLSTAHTELLRASSRDPEWEIAPRAAIGDREGEVEIHCAGNSVSSSILEMLGSHSNAAPDSAYVGGERVRLTTLDTLGMSYLTPSTVSFLKIDTQGYEDRILDGAPGILANATGMQLELSLVPLYEGQQLFDSLIDRVRTLGFEIWSLCPGFFDPHTGRLLQVDAIFFRD